MKLAFTDDGWADYRFWIRNDKAMLRRLDRLIDETLRDPFGGIGKPEQLRHALAGAWSRRINDEHRLVYVIEGDYLVIVAARLHYR